MLVLLASLNIIATVALQPRAALFAIFRDRRRRRRNRKQGGSDGGDRSSGGFIYPHLRCNSIHCSSERVMVVMCRSGGEVDGHTSSWKDGWGVWYGALDGAP